MVDVERVFTVTPPVAEIQDYLRDFAHAEEWDPGTVSCSQASSGPVGVGTTWTNVSEFRGKETELTYTLTKDEPGHLQFVGENKTVTSTDDISLTAVDSGTRITYHADFEFHGLAKLAVPFVKGELEELGDKTQAQMTTVLNGR
jgi:carbon monoxide dehydrogenase subunit G